MKAIDLYSGIGGWTLGLKMAGIDVVASYEWWNEANQTHNFNFGKSIPEVDIRKLDLSHLPQPGTIDFVVGSPPCTQFSFANRGGSGDIQDGLVDIYKFLSIVAHLKPRYWAFENVPRVSQILARELLAGGALECFQDMVKVNSVFDMSEFGLPQKRSRAIIGDFPVHFLEAYKARTVPLHLRDVIEGLSGTIARDPIYGNELPQDQLSDHDPEPYLTQEEERLNREQKSYHPVFNRMQFPDSLDRPARTVTALCTRVSRESIIIAEGAHFRRLTIRERALLQSFPATYQFYGKTYESKIKMVGNAIPPLMTYYIAQAMLDTPVAELRSPKEARYQHPVPAVFPTITPPTTKNKKFSAQRKFKAAIPGLRFGSGMRFELENVFEGNQVQWRVNFFYGSSKDIRSLALDSVAFEAATDVLGAGLHKEVLNLLAPLTHCIRSSSPETLQLTWIHRNKGLHPYELCDLMGEVAASLHESIAEVDTEEFWNFWVALHYDGESATMLNEKKLFANIRQLFVGIVVGSWVNSVLETTTLVATG